LAGGETLDTLAQDAQNGLINTLLSGGKFASNWDGARHIRVVIGVGSGDVHQQKLALFALVAVADVMQMTSIGASRNDGLIRETASLPNVLVRQFGFDLRFAHSRAREAKDAFETRGSD